MSSKKLAPAKRGANPDRMTAQQQLFVEAFFAERKMNASIAAKQAGYSGKNAGAKLLANPVVKAVIQKRMGDILYTYKATRERLLEELGYIALQNPLDILREDGSVIPLAELPQSVARSISRMKVRYVDGGLDESGNPITATEVDVSFHDKLTAVDLLMRHYGMFQPVELTVKTDVNWDAMIMPHANPQAALEEAIETDPIENRILALEMSSEEDATDEEET